MAIQTTAYLKTRFENGDVPTEQDFIDFIDTMEGLKTITQHSQPGVIQNQVVNISNVSDPSLKRLVQVYEYVDGAAIIDSSLDFDAADEGNFAQEDAVNGTDFVSGSVLLHTSDALPANAALYVPSLGPNGNTTIVDSSTNNLTLVNAGGGTVADSTTQKNFGDTSLRFDETSFLTGTATTELALGSGNWTLEYWAYHETTVSSVYVFSSGGIDASMLQVAKGGSGTGYINLNIPGMSVGPWLIGLIPLVMGQWYHVAIVRNGNTISIYVDGVFDVSSTLTTPIDPIVAFKIGEETNTGAGYRFKGYLEEFCIHVGLAKYTTNFNPTGPLSVANYPTGQSYWVSTDTGSSIPLTNVSTITSVSFTVTNPVNTTIKGLASFDGRTTWSSWNGSSWTNLGALDLDVFDFSTNGNTIAEMVTGFTSLTITDETALDFAFDLGTTDVLSTPSIDQITVNYTEVGCYDKAIETDYEISLVSDVTTRVEKLSAGTNNIKVNIIVQ